MAATITYSPKLQGIGKYNFGALSGPRQDSINLSQNGFGVTIPGFTYGNASTYSSNLLKVNDWYSALLTIGATTTVSINFNTGSQKNPFGTALAWTFVKYVLIAVQSPDGIISVKVGPQSVANVAKLWFDSAEIADASWADAYENVYFVGQWIAPKGGWPITASTACLLPITNSGASSLNVAVLALGGS